MAGGVTDKILEWLAQQETGQAFSLGELTELGLTESQGQTGMYRIIKNGKWPVEVISQGHLWRNAAVPSEPQEQGPETMAVVERLGEAAVLRDGEGWLYLAKRIGVADD